MREEALRDGGLPNGRRQDYIERKLLDESVSVIPSSRIARSLSRWMQSIYLELIIARHEGRALDADIVWIARAVAEEYAALSSTTPIKDANKAMLGIERG